MDSLDLNKRITRLLNDLIEIKGYIQEMVPTREIDVKVGEAGESVAKMLLQVHGGLKGLMAGLNLFTGQEASTTVEPAGKLRDFDSSGFLVVVARKQLQERIARFESMKFMTVLTGGPLEPSLYKVINPNLPDSALMNISKKIEKVYKQIEGKGKGKGAILIIAIVGKVVDDLLIKSGDELSNRMKKDVVVIQFENESAISEIALIERLLKIKEGERE
ncbi:MAG: DUF2100 domain-containing protein [Promethearchaeota archaeon]